MNGEHPNTPAPPTTDLRVPSFTWAYRLSNLQPGIEIALKRKHWVVGDTTTGQGIAIVFENEDYVRLMAAAPDLLAALRAVVSVADRKTDEFDLAHAAIAKATGEHS